MCFRTPIEMDNTLGKKPEWVKEPPPIDFKYLNEPLLASYNLVIAPLKKDRSGPPGFELILELLLTTNRNTYRAITSLIDKDREPKLPFQAQLLTRSMADGLFTLVALKTNPVEMVRRYELAGYRENWEEYQRERTRHGSDPDWANWLAEKEKFLRASEQRLGPIPDPSKVDYWPTPHQMLRAKLFSNEDGQFLRDFYEWIYGPLSSLSHLKWRGIGLSFYAMSPEAHWVQGMFETYVVSRSMALLLMLVSEVEAFKKYGVHQRIRFAWTVLAGFFGDAKEWYDARYAKILAQD